MHAADLQGFGRFENLKAYTLPEGHSDVEVAAVEAALATRLRALGMGARPRSPGGVHDNLRWLLSFQGVFVPSGVDTPAALSRVCARVKHVAQRVTEAPYKPTSEVINGSCSAGT